MPWNKMGMVQSIDWFLASWQSRQKGKPDKFIVIIKKASSYVFLPGNHACW